MQTHGDMECAHFVTVCKVKNFKLDMERMQMHMGITEMITEISVVVTVQCIIADKRGIGGVGILLNKELEKRVKGYVQQSGRIILVRLNIKPLDIVMIRVYMPATNHDNEAAERI